MNIREPRGSGSYRCYTGERVVFSSKSYIVLMPKIHLFICSLNNLGLVSLKRILNLFRVLKDMVETIVYYLITVQLLILIFFEPSQLWNYNDHMPFKWLKKRVFSKSCHILSIFDFFGNYTNFSLINPHFNYSNLMDEILIIKVTKINSVVFRRHNDMFILHDLKLKIANTYTEWLNAPVGNE